MRKAVCVLILWAAGAAAQSVEGTVVDSVTGNGIPGVKVDLVAVSAAVESDDPGPPGAQPAAYSTTTDEQGYFRLEGVKAGRVHPAIPRCQSHR